MSPRAEPAPDLIPGRPAASVEDLLAGATARTPLVSGGKSHTRLEQVVMGEERLVVKHLHCDDDWTARATGDLSCRPFQVWRSGLLHTLPSCLDHAVVAAASAGRDGWGAVLVMRDVSPWLVPDGNGVLPLAQHRRFLDHTAALHAAFWDYEDTLGLTPLAHRYLLFGPWLWETEAALASGAVVPELARAGWERFSVVAPRAAALVSSLLEAPWPLVEALERTPATLLHGDLKAANLGSLPDLRTILLDWAFPGRGPACSDLAWYLLINGERLPESPEEAIAAYRRSLAAHGVRIGGWWERQLGLALLGAVVQLGWDLALHGRPGDLAWWEARALDGAHWLH